MARYVTTVRTPRPPAEAFAYLADLGNFAEWDPGVTAALLVEFISQGAALTLLWLLGWQAAQQMRAAGPRMVVVATIVVALVTLVITAVGYVVLSGFIHPFVSKGIKQAVDWIFILGVVAAASWFILALFAGADDLIAAVRDGLGGKKRA